MKQLLYLMSVVCLIFSSSAFALDPILIGDFESGESSTGRYDLWYGDGLVLDDVTDPAVAATRGTYSLECISDTGGWGPAISYPINERADKFDVYELAANEGAVIGFDITFESVPGDWVQIGHYTNNGAPVGPGWEKDGWVDVPGEYLDGLPHPWAVSLAPLQASLQSVVDAQDDGGWYNVGIAFNTGEGNLTVYIDNVWIYPEGMIDTLLPHSPVVEQEKDLPNNDVNVTLKWQAAAASGYAVNPDIVNQHVFLGTENDPNLYYIGATNADPGADPNSQLGPIDLDFETIYFWVVVEEMDGSPENLTVGVSTLDQVNENSLVGPNWIFETISIKPSFSGNPEYQAVFPTEMATFTAEFSSPTAITNNQWFLSTDNGASYSEVTTGITLDEVSTPNTSTLTITGVDTNDEGWYYCKLTNADGFRNSKPAGLAVKRKVASYEFDNSLVDSVAGNNGTAKIVGPGTPDISYFYGVDGTYQGAVRLNVNELDPADPNQSYIELPSTGYPKANPGGAMEAGTVMCWIKTSDIGRIMGSLNSSPDTTAFHFGIDSDFDVFIRSAEDITNTVSVTDDLDNGTWHFLAAVWSRGGQKRAYTGTLGADGIASTPATSLVLESFTTLENNMIIGAQNNGGVIGSFLTNALIDKLGIYNYALTDTEITDIYNALSGQGICAATYANAYDFDGDCIVSLSDFASFASGWLSCGMLPESTCGN